MPNSEFNLEHSVIQLKTEVHHIREGLTDLKQSMKTMSEDQRKFEWLVYGTAIAGLFSVLLVVLDWLKK